MQILLDAGAFIDEIPADRSTALTEAALTNNVKLAKLLVDAGADIDGCALDRGRTFGTANPLSGRNIIRIKAMINRIMTGCRTIVEIVPTPFRLPMWMQIARIGRVTRIWTLGPR